jgi:hypothetical protein
MKAIALTLTALTAVTVAIAPASHAIPDFSELREENLDKGAIDFDQLREENLDKGAVYEVVAIDFDQLREENLDKGAVDFDQLRQDNLDKDAIA